MDALLIGCGAMGLRHAQALRNEGIHISGALDVSQQALQNGIEQEFFKPEAAYTEPGKAFNESAADLAVISTTAPYHHDYLSRAAAIGVKYILCEKPLAPSLAQCHDMLRICQENDIRCAVNHQRRFIGQYLLVREQIESGNLGSLVSFQVSAGNFGIAMNGSHYIEIASYLFGERFELVTGWLNDDDLPNPRGAEFRDFSGCIRAVTNSGKRFYLDASGDQGHGVSTLATGRNGQIQIDDLEGRIHVNQRKVDHLDEVTARYAMPWETSTEQFSVDIVAVTQKVVSSLLTGGEYPTLEDGLHTIEVLAAAHVSNERGHEAIKLAGIDEHRDRVFPWA